jgi:heme O synthase-like polyprenyltransferase
VRERSTDDPQQVVNVRFDGAMVGTQKSAIMHWRIAPDKGAIVGLILLVLLLAILLGVGGIAAHFLWFLAMIVLVFWLAGFAMSRGRAEGRRGWYKW